MTKAIFIFIATNLLLLPLGSTFEVMPADALLIITLPFILFLGIPHGAIDNILYKSDKENKVSNVFFIAVYLIFIGFNIILWVFMPVVAYLAFLLLSAYHFGQSEFSHYLTKQGISQKALFLGWGVALLSGLIYFNIFEINAIISNYESFAQFNTLHTENLMFYTFILSSGFTLILLIVSTIKRQLTTENLFMEILIFTLVMCSFYLMPLLVGFTLYFVILHSYKVMEEEFKFLKSKKIITGIKSFVKLLTPFSLLSFVGIIFLFSLIYFEIIGLSYGYLVLIIISSITLPHVFVMDHFYKVLIRIGFLKS